MIIVNKALVNAKNIAKSLKNGGLVILPFDTSYGVCALATSKWGVDKLMQFKGNRNGKPISIVVSTLKMAKKYVLYNKIGLTLTHKYTPGEITIISKSKKVVDYRIDPTNTLGVRIINNTLINEIVSVLGEGITSSSANPTGLQTPYSVDEVLKNLTKEKLELVDIIVDEGTLDSKISTVVNTTNNKVQIVRQGSLVIE